MKTVLRLPDCMECALGKLPQDVYGTFLPPLRRVLADNAPGGRVAKFQAR